MIIAIPIVPAATAAHSMEVLTQLRPTDCILDGFRIGLGGAILDKRPDISQIIPVTISPIYCLHFQHWSRDIQIRRNMLTSA
jgi:hypothetical protein